MQGLSVPFDFQSILWPTTTHKTEQRFDSPFFKLEPERGYYAVPDLSEKLQSRLCGRQIRSSPTLRCEYAIGIEIHRHAMNVY